MQEMGPRVYNHYLRRLECLTICWCHSKGSTFPSVIIGPWVYVWSGAWAFDLRMPVRLPTTWANQLWSIVHTFMLTGLWNNNWTMIKTRMSQHPLLLCWRPLLSRWQRSVSCLAASSPNWCCWEICGVFWTWSESSVSSRSCHHCQHVPRVWCNCWFFPCGWEELVVSQTDR